MKDLYKFMVWDKHKERLLDVVSLDFNVDWRQGVDPIKNIVAMGDGHEDILNGTVMQTTGMFDKDQKEIFEGHVVSFKANYTNKPCGWLRGIIVRNGTPPFHWGVDVMGTFYEIGEETEGFEYSCKVLGHILENPELIMGVI
jgi:uncharacterized phage protein (TIGR01671 family)